MGKYLDFYNECVKEQRCNFLCHVFTSEMYGKEDDPLFALFLPNDEELDRHYADGYCSRAWGVHQDDPSDLFSPLRQNIVLLLAAMNGEFNKKSNPKKRYGK